MLACYSLIWIVKNKRKTHLTSVRNCHFLRSFSLLSSLRYGWVLEACTFFKRNKILFCELRGFSFCRSPICCVRAYELILEEQKQANPFVSQFSLTFLVYEMVMSVCSFTPSCCKAAFQLFYQGFFSPPAILQSWPIYLALKLRSIGCLLCERAVYYWQGIESRLGIDAASDSRECFPADAPADQSYDKDFPEFQVQCMP